MCALVLPATLARAQDNQGQGQGQGQGQDQGPGRQRGRGNGGNFDPAQFRQQMMDRLREQLGANDDEWKVLQPKIEKVTTAQREARFGGGFGGFGGRGNRGGGGPGGGGDNNQPQSAVGQASQDLRRTLENKDASADEIGAKLKSLREAREKAQAELQTAQKELKEVLTQRQEATLVSFGMLD
jgi:flagellar motility protein MotE (MotC chaperone)